MPITRPEIYNEHYATEDYVDTAVAAAGGGLAASVKTANYTITEDEDVGVDSSGGTFTITLKATPSAGDVAIIRDVGQSCGTTNVAIARNGSTINGAATDENLDVDNGMYMFVYNGSTWKFTPFSGPGLNEAEVDARIAAVAPTTNASYPFGPAVTFTVSANIADDAASSFGMPNIDVSAGTLLVACTDSTRYGAFAFRPRGSPWIASIASAGTTTTTGVLAGTTGVDGDLTISAGGDNNIYVENRTGALLFVVLTIGVTQ